MVLTSHKGTQPHIMCLLMEEQAPLPPCNSFVVINSKTSLDPTTNLQKMQKTVKNVRRNLGVTINKIESRKLYKANK